jgi:tetratricopeptide (TPR) repeat protein
MLTARPRPSSSSTPSAVLARLERAVRCSEGFRLCFVRCDDVQLQDQMCAGLQQRLRGKRISDLRLTHAVESVQSELSGASRAAAIIVRGLEHSILGEHSAAFLERWEAEAKEIGQALTGLLLVWLPEEALNRLALQAPALWAQRSTTYEVFSLHLARPPEPAGHSAAEANGTAPVAPESDGAEAPGTEPKPVAEAAADPAQPSAETAAERPVTAPETPGEVEEAEEEDQETAGEPRELPPLHALTLAQKQAEIDRRMLRLQESVRASPNPDLETQHVQARLLYEIGVLYVSTGEWGRAAASLEESAATFNVVDDRRARGQALLQLGVTRHNQGKLDDAAGLYELSLRIAREVGDGTTESQALHQVGMVEQSRGNLEQATRLFQESLAAKRKLGDRRGIAATLHQLGALRQRARDLPGAIELYGESLDLKRRLGDRAGMATTLHQLGTAEHQQGRLDEAMHCYEESLQIKKAVGDRAGTAVTLGQIGRIHQQRGELREALQHYATSWLIFRSLQSHYADLAQKLIRGIRDQSDEEQFEGWLKHDLRSVASQIREALLDEPASSRG